MKHMHQVGLALQAAQGNGTPISAEAWVRFCVKAADEAAAAVRENPPVKERKAGSATLLLATLRREQAPEFRISYETDPELRLIDSVDPERGTYIAPLEAEELTKAIREAEIEAFRLCMPSLSSRRNAKGYIACVAAGAQRRYFTSGDVRSMLYAAQMTLAAHPQRNRTPRQSRRKVGFTQ